MHLSARIVGIARTAALVASAGAAIYGALGVLQSLSLYQGARTLWNVNLWSAVVLAAVLFAALLIWPGAVFGSSKAALPKRVVFWLSVAVLATWPLVRELAAVDACLDSGGSYDAVLRVCSMSASFPFIPLYRTHGFFMVAATLATLLAALSYLWSRSQRSALPSAA